MAGRPPPDYDASNGRRASQPYGNQNPPSKYNSRNDGYNNMQSPPPTGSFSSFQQGGGAPPRAQYDDYGRQDSYIGSPAPSVRTERPYAPSDPRPHDFNQLAPYNDEKAEAGFQQYDGSAYSRAGGRGPPPSEYTRRPIHDERYDSRCGESRFDDRSYDSRYDSGGGPYYDDRDADSRYYPGDDRSYDSRYDYRDAAAAGGGYDRDRYYDDRDRARRRRDDDYYDDRRGGGRDPIQEKILRYPSDPKNSSTAGARDLLGATADGSERGHGAALLGGAGGALIGHEMTDGVLGTLGGLVVGALAAKTIEKVYENRKAKQAEAGGKGGRSPRARSSPPARGGPPGPREGRYVEDERRY